MLYDIGLVILGLILAIPINIYNDSIKNRFFSKIKSSKKRKIFTAELDFQFITSLKNDPIKSDEYYKYHVISIARNIFLFMTFLIIVIIVIYVLKEFYKINLSVTYIFIYLLTSLLYFMAILMQFSSLFATINRLKNYDSYSKNMKNYIEKLKGDI